MKMHTDPPPSDGATIKDVRGTLYEAMRAVRAGTLDVERAKQIADLGRVLVDTAKAEVDYLRVTGESAHTGFVAPAPKLIGGRT